MARNEDYRTDHEVPGIMEKMLDKFPAIFDGFDIKGIHFIVTCKKKSKHPIKLRTCGYPFEVFTGRPYLIEVFDDVWSKIDVKRKNLAVFHIMCAIPNGGFDVASKYYGKRVRPQIVMYDLEFAAAGGIPNWMENSDARDPMDLEVEDLVPIDSDVDDVDPIPFFGDERSPVTAEAVAAV